MAELGDFLVSGDTTVNIDVDMLDYGYIGKCEDAKILRGIVDTLKSGKEGIYPELCEAAEERLFSIIPEKERRRIMRLKHKTTPDEVNDAEHDLNGWQTEVCLMDNELRATETATVHKLPPVRGQKIEKLDIPGPKKESVPASTNNSSSSSSSKNTGRLSGYDFHAWEKFNVDEALATLDEEEVELEKEVQNSRLQKKKAAEEAARKRMERHTNALDVIRAEMNMSNLSSVQRKTRAVREKQKGNESFRSGENEEAYSYYSRSLALDDSVAAVYSNRALVCLRTGKLETAEDDCSRALFLDPSFMKARSRRGIARLKSGKYELAIRDFDLASEHDSSNKELLSLLQKAKEKYLEVEGKEYLSEKDKERQKAALLLAIANGLPIKVTAAPSSDALLFPVATSAVDLLYSGVCEIVANPSETLTRISIEEDSDSSDEEEDHAASEGFTRIQIDDDSDTEDEEEGGEGGDSLPPPSPHSEDKEGFVRIAITDNSDSDSDEQVDEEGSAVSVKEKQTLVAENLKTQANAAMQGGDLATAIRLYGECVAIDGTSPVAIAAYGNRSLAHLKLEQFANVLEDTNIVLSHEPSNLKALYRRALAFEATADLESAIKDVEAIVQLQPQNELALEARERFRAAQHTTAAQVSPNLKVGKEPNVEEKSTGDRKDEVKELEKSIDLKNQGNDAMKTGKCEAAIDLYTRAIACDASNILFFNNRAQAYIKTLQFENAEADASHVIQHTTDQSPNLKAYYRRALARKGINTMESLQGAQDDASFILSLEPDNKAAIIEKQKIDSLLKIQVDLKNRAQNKAVEELIVTKESKESKESSPMSGLKERSSTLKVRPPPPSSQDQIAPPLDNSVPLAEVTSPPPPPSLEKEKKTASAPASRTTAAKDISVKTPSVPADPPKTVYEFERIWRGLKNHPALFAQYLQGFKKSTYKKVLKETCSPDLLSSLLVSVRDHLLKADGHVEKGVSVLEGLASIPKYEMIRFVLPGEDLACMSACVDYVSVHLGAERADGLRAKLKL